MALPQAIEMVGETGVYLVAHSRAPATVKVSTTKQKPNRARDSSGRGVRRASGARRSGFSARVERLIESRLEGIFSSLVDAAEAGDKAAARLIVDRFYPAPRDRRISFALRPITCIEEAISASSDLLAAVARGEITPAEGEAIAKMVHNYIEASGLRAFESRLEALEAAFPTRR